MYGGLQLLAYLSYVEFVNLFFVLIRNGFVYLLLLYHLKSKLLHLLLKLGVTTLMQWSINGCCSVYLGVQLFYFSLKHQLSLLIFINVLLQVLQLPFKFLLALSIHSFAVFYNILQMANQTLQVLALSLRYCEGLAYLSILLLLRNVFFNLLVLLSKMIDGFLDLVVLLSEVYIVIVKIVIVEVKFVYFLVVEYSLLLHLLPFFFNDLGLLARNCLCWSILQAGYLLFQILDCSAVSLNVVVGHSDLVDFLYDLSLQ